jgi:adenosylcobinamide-GDP ribazoletransferase
VRNWWRRLGVAFGFLTRVPVPHTQWRAADLALATPLFAVVGLVIAALSLAARLVAEMLWGPVMGTVVGVLTAVIVTGALHEDGLADTADGLWGGADPAERLAIMRDSRLGTYGTIALLAVLGLRVGLLATTTVETFAVAMISGHVLGRAAVVLLVRMVPPVVGSSSAALVAPLGPGAYAVAAILALTPVALAAGVLTAVLVPVAISVTAASAVILRRRLGGVNGDAVGATVVLVEVAVIAVVAAWQRLA